MDAAPLMTALERAGYRLTGPRREVARIIADQTGHFAAADVMADPRARKLGVGRATVFRTLDVLAGLGVVERIDLPTGAHAYVACEPVHHHHVVCSGCGRSEDVGDAGVAAVVRQVARRTGFRIDDHRLELFGRCPECRATEATT